MEDAFIERNSIMRSIWGDADIVLLIFAGAAAEFALNRAVEWLFFTDNLPKDPIGRLFSTVHYAQQIVFATEAQAQRTLASISAIHAAVEGQRGAQIPQWAYRDVLYLLIDYSQRAHGLLYRRLNAAELEDLYAGFMKLGHGLHIAQLPPTFTQWQEDRENQLESDLAYSHYTQRLFEQYRRQLGAWRYQILLELQALLAPARVRQLLRLQPKPLLMGLCVRAYWLIGQLGLQQSAQRALIPYQYWYRLPELKMNASGR